MNVIHKLKQSVQSAKDKRKLVLKMLDCIEGVEQPDCHWTRSRFKEYLNLNPTEQTQYRHLLLHKCADYTKEINIVGKAILGLRGNKWSF